VGITVARPAIGVVGKISRGLLMAVGTYILCFAASEAVRACSRYTGSPLTPDIATWLQDNLPRFENWANAWTGGYFLTVCRVLAASLVPLIAAACVYHCLWRRKFTAVTQCRSCRAVLSGLATPVCPACGQEI
jgi:hypothetical protein